MIPLILATVLIIPGAVPVVAEPHPDETAMIEQLKDARPVPVVVLAPNPRPVSSRPVISWTAAEMDDLLSGYFAPADMDWARRVSACESSWNQNAYNRSSGASGFFQHLAKYWEQRSAWAGWPGADIFDPHANVAVAAWMFYEWGPSHWVCK